MRRPERIRLVKKFAKSRSIMTVDKTLMMLIDMELEIKNNTIRSLHARLGTNDQTTVTTTQVSREYIVTSLWALYRFIAYYCPVY